MLLIFEKIKRAQLAPVFFILLRETQTRLRCAQLARAVGESAPPVLLASLTSIIGYASLIPADSRALASFGVLAILGEVACVVVAIVFVPALWAARRRR